MGRLTLLCLALSVTTAAAQPEQPAYSLPSPKGWDKELIQLPPGFAPKMSWRGHEDLRFAPGMFDPDSESFFSYTVLFWLPADAETGENTLRGELLIYYQGLAQAVLGKTTDVDVSRFEVKLAPVATKKPLTRDGAEVAEYTGTLTWVEPFKTKKAQTLRLEVQAWECRPARRRCVFLCASPQPTTAEVWGQMREIRDGFRCTGAKE